MTNEFYAHVRVGDCDIAVPAHDIVQAVDLPPTGAMPLPRHDERRHGALAGLIEFEGSVVPIVALDRWVPLGEANERRDPRALILRNGPSRIAIHVDALMGIKRIAPSTLRTVCHDAAAEELFEAVAPATGERPLLCLLEVARLMALTAAWCRQAEVAPGTENEALRADSGASQRPLDTVRFIVCTIGEKVWALPALAISRLEKTPKAEFRLPGRQVCGIGSWQGRKVPLVDLGFAHDQAGTSRPWMAIVVDGPHAIGLLVDSSERMVTLGTDAILPTPGDGLRGGTAIMSGLGDVSVLDIDALFSAVPEAAISRVPMPEAAKATLFGAAAAPGSTRAQPATDRSAEVVGQAPYPSDYLCFEADRPYASPAAGLVGVAALTDAAIDDLVHGRRATVDWRGQTLSVVNTPQIDGGTGKFEPRLAVVVEGAGKEHRTSAVAVRSLTRWLPARSAHRSSMWMHSVGNVNVITPEGSQRSESLVVVDLAQIAYLLD